MSVILPHQPFLVWLVLLSNQKIVATSHGTTNTRFMWQGYRLLQEQESGMCRTYRLFS
ncbi:hypothetical protein VB265_07355 [Enterobacter sichuanensis]|uniref:hypothetical protein n=1 Tax=Enterobacter TaxID=547 RepID=UPI001CD9DEB1|nr:MULTISPECIES: hypothetical protein [Enterobacter]MCA2026378.1 hypothetical protein [Enterobacter sp. K16B]MEA5169331.1 hypothetical protein [Enterobacter sichuanensis]